MFPIYLLASIFLHGLFLILVSFKNSSDLKPLPEKDIRYFSIFNFSLLEPSPPEVQAALPAELPVEVSGEALVQNYIEPPPPEVQAALPAELPVEISGEALVQNYIEVEEVVYSAAVAVSSAEYVRQNYNYIQRLIRAKLTYPSQARRAGIQGVTEVGFTIHEDGSISNVILRSSSGHAILDDAAIAVVFAAAPFPRPPTPARIAIPLIFSLR